MILPPRIPLGVFPTPLEPLPGLTKELGVEVLVKRDDLTGLGLGGNKVRKLEMLLAPAVESGADAVVTCGASQSNHCRCTAAAAARLGLRCHLVLFEGRHNELQGNLLLDHLFGARVEMRPATDWQRVDAVLAEAASAYRRPCVIPFGGSNALGSAAYAWCYSELRGQLGADGRGTVVCVTSSGATHAGLAVGAAGLGGPAVVGVPIGDPAPDCEVRVRRLAREAAVILGIEGTPRVTMLDGHQGLGYGIPTEECIDAIRLVARTEGLLLDPVYTGKAMAALIAGARSGELQPPLVFLHSGGTPALFAYATELI